MAHSVIQCLEEIHCIGLVWLVVAYFCNKLIFTLMVALKMSSKSVFVKYSRSKVFLANLIH